jgi:hypothetical protein
VRNGRERDRRALMECLRNDGAADAERRHRDHRDERVGVPATP